MQETNNRKYQITYLVEEMKVKNIKLSWIENTEGKKRLNLN